MSSSFESGISSWSDDGGSEGVNNVDGSIGTGSGGDLLTETLATTNTTTITAGTTDGGDYSRDVAPTPFYTQRKGKMEVVWDGSSLLDYCQIPALLINGYSILVKA